MYSKEKVGRKSYSNFIMELFGDARSHVTVSCN